MAQDDPAKPKPETNDKPQGGLFAPVWELYSEAQKVNPFVGYVLPALLLIVVGVLMIKYVAPYTGNLGAIRTILYLFFLLFFLMAFFATFADFFNGGASVNTAQRIPRIVIVVLMAAIGIFGAYQVAKPTAANCTWVAMLAGPERAEVCALPVRPTQVVLNGIIKVLGDPFAVVEGAQAKVLVDTTSMMPKVLETGDFSQTLPLAAIGKTAEVSVKIPSFSVLETKMAPIGRDGAIVKFVIDPARLPANVTITRTTSAAALAPVRDGAPVSASLTRTAWFNGGALRYDIFYCQEPDGDAVKSKILATQLQSVLAQQVNVGDTNIRAWPASTTAGYGNVRSGTVLINQPISGTRNIVVSNLQKLWAPFLPDGVSAGPRPVSSNFPKMTAVVCI